VRRHRRAQAQAAHTARAWAMEMASVAEGCFTCTMALCASFIIYELRSVATNYGTFELSIQAMCSATCHALTTSHGDSKQQAA
jgi:hypothetical protein